MRYKYIYIIGSLQSWPSSEEGRYKLKENQKEKRRADNCIVMCCYAVYIMDGSLILWFEDVRGALQLSIWVDRYIIVERNIMEIASLIDR